MTQRVSDLVSDGIGNVSLWRTMPSARQPSRISYQIPAAWETWLEEHGEDLSDELLKSIGRSIGQSIELVEKMIAAGMPEPLAWQFLPYGLHRSIDVGNFVEGGIRYGIED